MGCGLLVVTKNHPRVQARAIPVHHQPHELEQECDSLRLVVTSPKARTRTLMFTSGPSALAFSWLVQGSLQLIRERKTRTTRNEHVDDDCLWTQGPVPGSFPRASDTRKRNCRQTTRTSVVWQFLIFLVWPGGQSLVSQEPGIGWISCIIPGSWPRGRTKAWKPDHVEKREQANQRKEEVRLGLEALSFPTSNQRLCVGKSWKLSPTVSERRRMRPLTTSQRMW